MDMFEQRLITLKAISPVHIKNKDIEYGQGFIRRDENSTYALDSNKFAEYLCTLPNGFDLVKRYVNTLGDLVEKGKDLDHQKFFTDYNIFNYKTNRKNEDTLIKTGVFKYLVPAYSDKQFVRNGWGRPFIPGSTIKGFLRTAVMYSLVEKYYYDSGPNKVKSYIYNLKKEIDQFVNKSKNKHDFDLALKTFSVNLNHRIFQNCIYQDDDPRLDTKRDFFRCLKIKDSPPLKNVHKLDRVILSLSEPSPDSSTENENRGVIKEVMMKIKVQVGNAFYDFESNFYKENEKQIVELIDRPIKITSLARGRVNGFDQVGSEAKSFTWKLKNNENGSEKETIEVFHGQTTISLLFDQFLFNRRFKRYNLTFHNLDTLLRLAKKFSEKIWQFERDFFVESLYDPNDSFTKIKEFYSKEGDENKMRIGWGTGISGMTIFLLLNEEYREYLRNHLLDYKPGFPAPKSRKLLIKDNQIAYPLGWISFNQDGETYA